jgi:hypothetical protein
MGEQGMVDESIALLKRCTPASVRRIKCADPVLQGVVSDLAKALATPWWWSDRGVMAFNAADNLRLTYAKVIRKYWIEGCNLASDTMGAIIVGRLRAKSKAALHPEAEGLPMTSLASVEEHFELTV